MDNVGVRLRRLREERGMSMRALAVASGLSANALSMIERGKTSPSVNTLNKLAHALGIPIAAFFDPQPPRQKVVFVRSDERSHLPFPKGVWEGLGGDRFVGRVEPFVLVLQSGASSGSHTLAHSGHEFVICLRGKLEYEAGNRTFLLDAGDSLLFAAQLPHRWHNPHREATNALIVLAGFSDDEQPHVMHWKKGE